MIKYIKIDNGDLYAYNEKGITIVYNEKQEWNLSSLNYVSILYNDEIDYFELTIEQMEQEYNHQISKQAESYFKKINSMLKK